MKIYFQKEYWRSAGIRKLLKVMKLTFVLLITAFLQISQATHAQKITYTAKNVPLEQVFKEIQNQTNYRFLYTDEMLKGFGSVNVKVTNATLDKVLSRVFEGLSLTYTIEDNTIIIKRIRDKMMVPKAQTNNIMQELLPVTITGKVVDSKGESLPGVSVKLKGTTNGTTTGMDGSYTLNLPETGGTLVFSYIGFLPKEISFSRDGVLNVTLLEDTKALDEVIVTALGIKREVRSLGYATATVTKAELTENRQTQVFGALQGKLSGVNISLPSTGPAGSTKIRIRGQSSFSGENNPLIVLDGIPMDNSRFESRRVNSSDGGDGLSSINPDNIESMTVLKGAAASALYGSRAKDGVIMITTKKRGDNMGLGVEYNVNYTASAPQDFTDFQYEYGQGERGLRPTTAWPTSGTWSFGEKFAPGMTQVLFDNVTVPYVAQPNRIKNFYDVGQNLTNSITLSNRTEKGGFSTNISNSDNAGIVPNSAFHKKAISFGFLQNVSKNLSIDGSINYSNEYNENPPQSKDVYSLQVPLSVATMSTSMPLDLLKKYAFDANGDELIWGRFLPRTNPYFSIAKKFENIKRDRFLGNVALKYQLTDWLFIQGRIAQDFYSRDQDYNIPTGYLGQTSAAPAGFVNGSYTTENLKFRERNYDFLLGANHKIGNIGMSLTLGGNQMYRRVDYNSVGVQDFIQRGLYTIGNGRTKDNITSLNERAVNSLYSAAEVSYKDFLYLNVTGRNDWFSTLSPDNRSIFYPSITGSFVFSDAFQNNMPKWLSFGKLRLGYAQVGDDNVAAYSNQLYYTVNSNLFPNPQGANIPAGTIQGSTVPNANLRPLMVSEIEGGIDLRLFNNRIGLDVSLYRKISKNQIVSAQISNTSSYTSKLVNVGRSMNKGVEVMLTATPIDIKSFKWDVAFNTSYNRSKVLQLGENPADTMITIGQVRQIVGRPLGQLYQFLQKRDASGNLVYEKSSGFPVQGDLVNVGTNQPTWFGGINNVLTIKGVSLSALITYKLGKDYVMTGGDNANFWRHGLHKGTLPGRDVGYVIGAGVNEDGSVNKTKADVQPYYEAVNTRIFDQYIENLGYWKLSQASISYDLSKFLPAKSFIRAVRLSAVANNVATLKKWTSNMDPEELTGNINDNGAGRGFSSLPLTRNLGFNLNLKF